MQLRFLLFAFCSLACTNLFSQVPGTLSYQGVLMQNDGITPLTDGAHTIVFNFYNVATGGAALQTRTVSVNTTKGLFTCIIGDGTTNNAALPSTLSSQQIYLGIKVDGGIELLPRAILTSTTYAYQAQSAYTISDGAVTNVKLGSDIDAGKITAGTLSAARLPSTAGVIGHIPFWNNPATTLTSDAGLFWNNDAASKRLGVGNSNPQARIHISGNGSIPGDDDIMIEHNGASSPSIAFRTSGGTFASPVAPAAGLLGRVRFTGYTGTVFSSGAEIQSNAETTFSSTANANLTFLTSSGGSLAERMRITASGTVVVDPVGANTGTIANALIFGLPTSGEGIGSKRTAGGNLNGLDFYTNNGTTRMSITQAGNVGIGTSSPSYKLDVNGEVSSSAGNSFRMRQSNYSTFFRNDNTSFYLMLTDAGNPDGSWNSKRPFMIDLASGNLYMNGTSLLSDGTVGVTTRLTVQGSIYANANITADQDLVVKGNAFKPGGGSWGIYSDKRLKKDIVTYNDGLESIRKINPVKFHYNGLADMPTEKEYVGIIAQEIKEIAPYMISTTKAKLNKKDLEETAILQFDGSAMIFMLVNGVKELDQRIKELTAEIQTVKTENKELLCNAESKIHYQGKGKLINGEATIQLPSYFNSLTKDGSATIILTAIGKKPYLLSYEELTEKSFKVYGTESLGEFSWEVKAERQDVPNLIVEPDKTDVSVYGNGPYKYYVPKQKRSDVSAVNTKSEKE